MSEKTTSHKEVDFLVRGGDLISLTFAINLLRQRQEVLFYDEKPNEGRFQNQHLWGEMEIRHLELLGQKIESKALSNIRDYTHQVNINFICGDTRVKLSNNPWENFYQLFRKFPNWFDLSKTPQYEPRDLLSPETEEKFNKEFTKGLNRVSENCFRYRQLENLTASLFETHCPDYLLHLADGLLHLFRQEPFESHEVPPLSIKEKEFILGLRFFTQQQLDLKWGKVEIYHFLFSLLSPRFSLDEEKLLKDLQVEFCKFGGHWGDPTIFNSPPFYDQKFLLQTQNQQYKADFCFSFINSMTKDNNFFHSSLFNFNNDGSKEGHLIQLRSLVKKEYCLNPIGDGFDVNEWSFVIEPDRIAGDLAIWLIVPGKDDLEFFSWARESNCLDAKWFNHKAVEVLERLELLKSPVDAKNLNFTKTGGISYLSRFEPGAYSYESHLPRRMPFVVNDSPNKKNNKNGKYFGKKRGPSMGSLGSILEIKDASYWAERG